MVRLHWDGDQQPPLDMDLSCLANPNKPTCPPTPTVAPKPYIVEIIAYHGWINPKSGHEGCFIVTKTTTIMVGGITPLTYNKGAKLCKPPPKEKSLLEKLGDIATGALGWISEAYNDLQDAVVSILAKFVPSGLCSESCLKTLLQTAGGDGHSSQHPQLRCHSQRRHGLFRRDAGRASHRQRRRPS
jgi:hypothetical protein